MNNIKIEPAQFCSWCDRVLWPNEKKTFNPFLWGFECSKCYCGYGA